MIKGIYQTLHGKLKIAQHEPKTGDELICSGNLNTKILYSHKPMHYNGTEINTNIQYQYLHAHDKMMDVTQSYKIAIKILHAVIALTLINIYFTQNPSIKIRNGQKKFYNYEKIITRNKVAKSFIVICSLYIHVNDLI